MAPEFELFSRDGGIFDNKGNRVSLKGVNWFGLETSDYAMHGLWQVSMTSILNFLEREKFNAIRLPFSCQAALDLDVVRPTNINFGANPGLKGLTTCQIIDVFVDECAKRGILVMLDNHRLPAALPNQPNAVTHKPLWYFEEYTEEKLVQGWQNIASRYKDAWNVVAADLYNEPHGDASWSSDNPNEKTDWRLAAQRIGKKVLEVNPRLLIFVEGVCDNSVDQPPEPCWWGGNLAGFAKARIDLPVKDKLVLSPHLYGPDVANQPYFPPTVPADKFPANMPPIWQRHFGYIKGLKGPAICPGEWGGQAKPGSTDMAWQYALADWMVQNDITDSFYFCLNPNSGDTGGLLENDWETPVTRKLEICVKAHPNPTIFPKLFADGSQLPAAA